MCISRLSVRVQGPGQVAGWQDTVRHLLNTILLVFPTWTGAQKQRSARISTMSATALPPVSTFSPTMDDGARTHAGHITSGLPLMPPKHAAINSAAALSTMDGIALPGAAAIAPAGVAPPAAPQVAPSAANGVFPLSSSAQEPRPPLSALAASGGGRSKRPGFFQRLFSCVSCSALPDEESDMHRHAEGAARGPQRAGVPAAAQQLAAPPAAPGERYYEQFARGMARKKKGRVLWLRRKRSHLRSPYDALPPALPPPVPRR